jgi:hypothetical protein
MPRLRQSDEQMSDVMLKALIESKAILAGIHDKKVLAAKMHMPLSTLYDRIRNPGTFRRRELQMLCKILKFTETEKASIL